MARIAPLTGPPATSGPIVFTLPDSSSTPGIPNTILGLIVAETAGSTASFRLHDGADATTASPVITSLISLTSKQTLALAFPYGLTVNSGKVYLEVVSGAFEGSIHW